MVRSTKDNEQRAESVSTAQEKPASGLTSELETLVSDYANSVEQTQTGAASSTKEAWARYWQSIKEIAAKATQTWTDSYSAYLEAYQKLPTQPDYAALQPVQDAWASHVRACDYTPDIVKAWNTAYEELCDALRKINGSTNEAIGAAGDRYSERLRAVLSARGLTNVDPATVQFLAYQIAAINAEAATLSA
jgi:hypothetical protein